MDGYVEEEITPEALAAERELYRPFTQSVRDLVDVTVRTLADPGEVRAAQAEIEAITARLTGGGLDGPYGCRYGTDGHSRTWGNAVVGLRNPIAPPLVTQHEESDRTRLWSDFHLGAAYEGPPTLVHGGVLSLVLDQLLGEVASLSGKPGMTGTLTVRYRRGTPLGDLRAEAWIDRVEGIKTFARGHVLGPDGVTAEAEGVFILPRWARDTIWETGDAGGRD